MGIFGEVGGSFGGCVRLGMRSHQGCVRMGWQAGLSAPIDADLTPLARARRRKAVKMQILQNALGRAAENEEMRTRVMEQVRATSTPPPLAETTAVPTWKIYPPRIAYARRYFWLLIVYVLMLGGWWDCEGCESHAGRQEGVPQPAPRHHPTLPPHGEPCSHA